MVLFVVTDAVEMAESFDAGCADVLIGGVRTVATRGVFSEIVNDGARGGQGLCVLVKAEAGEFSDTKLFAENALGIIPLEDPVFEPGFDAARAFEQRCFCSFEKLLRPGKQSFSGTKKLQFVAERLIRAGAGKFGGLKFSRGKIDVSEPDG